MRALSSACYTDARLYTLRIKIGTNQRAHGEPRIIELASGRTIYPLKYRSHFLKVILRIITEYNFIAERIILTPFRLFF